MGALVHYLPPYSPDYNPTELVFSKVKSSLRAMDLEMSDALDIETIVLAAANDCAAWIKSCDLCTD